MILCGLPYFCSSKDLAFLYPMFAGCCMQRFIISFGFPSVYFINLVNLPLASSIFFYLTCIIYHLSSIYHLSNLLIACDIPLSAQSFFDAFELLAALFLCFILFLTLSSSLLLGWEVSVTFMQLWG